MTPGTHKLPPLPYAYDALEPWMGAETVRLHHGKHHQSYVDGLNEAETELAKARASGDTKLVPYWQTRRAFNEGGHVLHAIWWHCMSPDGGGLPTGNLDHYPAIPEKVERRDIGHGPYADYIIVRHNDHANPSEDRLSGDVAMRVDALSPSDFARLTKPEKPKRKRR